MSEHHIRAATPADLEVVSRHRRCMFEEMGFDDPAALETMLAASMPVLRRGLVDGTYRGWLVHAPSGEVVAGGGVIEGRPLYTALGFEPTGEMRLAL